MDLALALASAVVFDKGHVPHPGRTGGLGGVAVADVVTDLHLQISPPTTLAREQSESRLLNKKE